MVTVMSTNTTHPKARRTGTGLYTLDTPHGTVTLAGNLRINATAPSWGYTAPNGVHIIEYGFGTLAEAVAHAAEVNR